MFFCFSQSEKEDAAKEDVLPNITENIVHCAIIPNRGKRMQHQDEGPVCQSTDANFKKFPLIRAL